MNRIYLDHSATTPVDPRVAYVMREYMLRKFGNPSSIHAFGREAKPALDDARISVAALLKCLPEELVFTSGGTEADNIAVIGYALKHRAKGNHIVIGGIEHPAVRFSAEELEQQGFNISWIQPDKYGEIISKSVAEALTDQTILVSIMHVNNEVGTINDIGAIGAICREREITFHTDAVQSFGKVPVNVIDMQVDMASVSSHKIYGPKGVGALYLREGIEVQSRTYGGHQERGVRSGTENLPGITGLGKAAEICRSEMKAEAERLVALRDLLHKLISTALEDVHLNGHPEKRLPGNLNLTFDGIEGEALLMALDLEGIAVSSGSACSSGSTAPSPVLTTIGLSDEEAQSSLRVTLGRDNTRKDMEITADVIIKNVNRLRAMAGV
ncbi:MAG: cysteine desulfurase [Calditrichaeota bacterium]|nr:cysteine desulfurase [Calditrichota bacterium]